MNLCMWGLFYVHRYGWCVHAYVHKFIIMLMCDFICPLTPVNRLSDTLPNLGRAVSNAGIKQ